MSAAAACYQFGWDGQMQPATLASQLGHAQQVQPLVVLSDESPEQGRNQSRELRFYSDPPHVPVLACTGENPIFLPTRLLTGEGSV